MSHNTTIIIVVVAFLLIAAIFNQLFHRTQEARVYESDLKLIKRVVQKEPVDMQALIEGRLWVVDGCIAIGETPQTARTVIWKAPFKIQKDNRGDFIRHPKSYKRSRIGEQVRFGGGYVEKLETDFITKYIEGGTLDGCKGPFIFVDTVE